MDWGPKERRIGRRRQIRSVPMAWCRDPSRPSAFDAENVPLGLAPTTSPSIAAFGIGDTTPVTVIIYNRLRMVQRWELKTDELTDEKISEILNATEQMVSGVKK